MKQEMSRAFGAWRRRSAGSMPAWGLAAGGALLAAVLAVAPVLPPDQARAHKGAQGVVKERMKLMMRIEKRLRPIARMATGKRPFDAAEVRNRAAELARHAARIPELFPQGSLQPPSEAAPSIWQRFDDFRHQAESMRQAAERLQRADAATLPAALKEMQATCKACHRQYRVEKE